MEQKKEDKKYKVLTENEFKKQLKKQVNDINKILHTSNPNDKAKDQDGSERE